MSAQDGFEGEADVKTHTVTQDAREEDGDVLPTRGLDRQPPSLEEEEVAAMAAVCRWRRRRYRRRATAAEKATAATARVWSIPGKRYVVRGSESHFHQPLLSVAMKKAPSSTPAPPAPPVQWNPALLVLAFGFIVCLFMAQIEFGRHETVGEVHGVLTADGGVSTKLDTILSTQSQLEVIATEFQAVRGMAWVPNEETAGYLLFADGKERGKVYRHRISQGIVPFDSISVYDSRSSSNGIALEQRSKLLVSYGAQLAMRVASARMRGPHTFCCVDSCGV